MKVLIIDEISMLDADILDSVNLICKTIKNNDKPFGGIQTIFVGDFFQLPPISSLGESKKFSFAAKAFKEAKLLSCYLEEQHRQKSDLFLDILIAIRKQSISENHIELLEARKKYTKKLLEEQDLQVPKLFTHNKNVDEINFEMLEKLKGEKKTSLMKTFGKKFALDNLIKSCLAPFELNLKIGAKIMCVKNFPEKGFMNGTLGEIHSLSENLIEIKNTQGRIIQIEMAEWSIEEDNKVIARIMQFPIRLAWAITIHKSQGMSLDSACMDLSGVFEYGQGYVALSRISSLDGLFLIDYNQKALSVDSNVFAYDKTLKENSLEILKRYKESDFSKIQNLQEEFILSLGGNLEPDENLVKNNSLENFTKSFKKDTKLETKGLVLEEISLFEIAKIRRLSVDTIISHLEDLLEKKDIEKIHIQKILSKSFLNIPMEVKNAFKKNGSSKLTPIFEDLKKEYTFEELKIYRLLL